MRRPDSRIRLAITGVGIICSIGRSREEVWNSILAGADGIRPLASFPDETFPTTLAAEVGGSLGGATPASRRERRRFSRSDSLAVIAAIEALQHAQSSGAALDLQETIVSTGTSTGGLLEGEDYYFRRRVRGRRRTPASRVLQQPTSGPSDAVARVLGLGGGVFSNATACASGGAAIGLAADLIRAGQASVALAGGTDALCRLTYSGFNVLQAVDQGPCRPFDASRAGITLGEGAAYLVIERWDDAIGRGAEILAE
ncbi:MAG: beta-ketoacyl synthase N-terminal-like domain-containing protein, partial [Thermoanaerobaculia bacterium]